MKYIVYFTSALALVAVGTATPLAAQTNSGFASPYCNPTPQQPCRAGTTSPAYQKAQRDRIEFERQQRLRQEQIRQQNLIRQQQEAARQAQYQRDIAAYRARQDQLQRQQYQQQQAQQQARNNQLNALASAPGAIRVTTYTGTGNRPYYRAFNNSPVPLRVYISYNLRGADGSYYNGTENALINGNGEYDWPFWPGPVDVTKAWNITVTNVRWER